MGLYVLNSFVLLNIDLVETPEYKDMVARAIRRESQVIEEQIYLQEQGVSFSYTDSISFRDRQRLVEMYQEFVKRKTEQMEREQAKMKSGVGKRGQF